MIKARTTDLVMARASNGWSQSDLAKKAGVSSSVVSRAENGISTSAKAAKKIADALEVKVAEIFTITSE